MLIGIQESYFRYVAQYDIIIKKEISIFWVGDFYELWFCQGWSSGS